MRRLSSFRVQQQDLQRPYLQRQDLLFSPAALYQRIAASVVQFRRIFHYLIDPAPIGNYKKRHYPKVNF